MMKLALAELRYRWFWLALMLAFLMSVFYAEFLSPDDDWEGYSRLVNSVFGALIIILVVADWKEKRVRFRAPLPVSTARQALVGQVVISSVLVLVFALVLFLLWLVQPERLGWALTQWMGRTLLFCLCLNAAYSCLFDIKHATRTRTAKYLLGGLMIALFFWLWLSLIGRWWLWIFDMRALTSGAQYALLITFALGLTAAKAALFVSRKTYFE